ncbi:MAG: hypothetical protein IJ721_08110 [Bacteroidales bacterium]|nr:hypothetical protein [Bacteroidales bacterium]
MGTVKLFPLLVPAFFLESAFIFLVGITGKMLFLWIALAVVVIQPILLETVCKRRR